MRHRPEIDGLRAVAVAPVVLFHAGVQQISGGFLGVDIFFVISGFLITSILISELASGQFSFRAFYKRRARRILPALLVVIVSSLPFAWLFMSHGEFLVTARSAIYVLLFASNFFFFKQSGYFERSAESSPLLHTWSLGVEEQYYIFFPVLLWLVWRRAPRLVAPVLGLHFVASLLLCIGAARSYPDFAFYLPLTRAWELLAGALCALLTEKPLTRFSNWLSAAGLAAILVSLFSVRDDMPWPSAITLLPVAGVCLILLYAQAGTPVARLLSSPLLRGLGLISYSVYLWHQPVFALARIQSFGAPEPAVMAALCGLVILLSVVSWRYVEQPWRNGKLPAFAPGRLAQTIAVTSIALLAGGLLAGFATKGFTALHTESQRQLMAYEESAYQREIERAAGPCLQLERNASSTAPSCLEGGQELMIWGDSHAGMLSIGIRAEGKSFVQMNAGSCPPVLGLDPAKSPACSRMNASHLAQVGKVQPKRLILHASWSQYDAALLLPKLRETIAAIRHTAPSAQILLVGGVPIWRPNLPRYMLGLRQEITPNLNLPNRNLPDVRALDAQLRAIASETGIAFYAPTELLCGDNACRAVVPDGTDWKLSTFDDAHLTPPAARLLAQKLPM